jgi:hypothetical protein
MVGHALSYSTLMNEVNLNLGGSKCGTFDPPYVVTVFGTVPTYWTPVTIYWYIFCWTTT